MCEVESQWHSLPLNCSDTRLHSLPETIICSLGFVETVLFACIVAAKYSRVTVLNKTVTIPMTSGVRWVLFFLALSFRYAVYAIANAYETDSLEALKVVFIAGMSLEGLVLFLLFSSLYHEWKYRSTVLATQGGLFRHQPFLNRVNEFVWSGRLPCLVLFVFSLVALTVGEHALTDNSKTVCRDARYLFWAMSGTLFALIASEFIIALLSIIKRDEDAPTIASKVALLVALVVMIPSLIPFAILHMIDGKLVDCESLHSLTPFDLFQIVALFSWLLLLFYIRAEYTRVLQECKLAIVGDIQAMLNFDRSWRSRDSHI